MSESIVDVLLVNYHGQPSYLVLSESALIVADVFPKIDPDKLFAQSTYEGWSKKDWTKFVAASAVSPLAAVLYGQHKAVKDSTVDSELKQSIRKKLEAYRETRDKSILKSLRTELLFDAAPTTKFQGTIPLSSVISMDLKLDDLTIVQKTETGLKAQIYGETHTWKFKILEDEKTARNFINASLGARGSY